MLATTSSGRWDEQCPKDSRSKFFIDYPFSFFEPLLLYLREKKLNSREPPAWPPAVTEDQLGLFMRMADYFGVTPLPSPVRTPSRFAGTNNSCDISGSPEAVRVSTDVPILFHALQVLGPRTQASARYIGWLAVYQCDIELVHEEVDYTVQAK